MILAPRPPFRASRRPPGGRLSRVPAGISHDDFQGSPPGAQGNSSRGSDESNSSMPVPNVPARLGIPAGLFRASLRVGRQDSKPAPGWPPGWQTRPRASLHRDWHQGLFAAICCTSLHSGTQHKSLSQKSKTITTFGLWVPLKTELCCLPATFRKWTLS